MQGESRGYVRFIRDLKVSYAVLSGVGATPLDYGDAETVNISRSGVRIKLDEVLPKQVLVQLHIEVPSRAFGIFVLGKVVSCRPAVERPPDYEAGVKFVGLLPPDLEQIITAAEEADLTDELDPIGNT